MPAILRKNNKIVDVSTENLPSVQDSIGRQSPNLVKAEIDMLKAALQDKENWNIKKTSSQKSVRINELAIEVIDLKRHLLLAQTESVRLNARIQELELNDQRKALMDQTDVLKNDLNVEYKSDLFKEASSAIKVRMGLPLETEIDIDTENWIVV